MSLALRAGLSWCICARQAVFLDLERDRYFCLPETLDGAFQRWAAGDAVSPADQELLVACGVAQTGDGGCVAAACHPPAMRDYAIGSTRSRPVFGALAAILAQLRARRRLKHLPLASIVSRIAAQNPPAAIYTQDEARLRQVAGAFATSAMFLRAADQCLPRAIAARRLCHRHGQDAALIFGVRLNPFSAHSWVQSGDAVIVGDLEQVRLYTPILVVR